MDHFVCYSLLTSSSYNLNDNGKGSESTTTVQLNLICHAKADVNLMSLNPSELTLCKCHTRRYADYQKRNLAESAALESMSNL